MRDPREGRRRRRPRSRSRLLRTRKKRVTCRGKVLHVNVVPARDRSPTCSIQEPRGCQADVLACIGRTHEGWWQAMTPIRWHAVEALRHQVPEGVWWRGEEHQVCTEYWWDCWRSLSIDLYRQHKPKKKENTHIYTCFWTISTCTGRIDVNAETGAENKWNIGKKTLFGKHKGDKRRKKPTLQEMWHLLTFDICHNKWKICHRSPFMTPSWRKLKCQKMSVFNDNLWRLGVHVITLWHCFWMS
jgi:hypothetical protein